jgi:glycosyltransferase 2 family protein
MRARTGLLWAIAIAVTVVFGWLAIRGVDLGEVWRSLREAEPAWLAASLAVLAVAIFVRAIRWRALFLPETRPGVGPATAATLVGLAVNSVLPMRAGEAARVIALGRTGSSRVESFATIVLERTLDVFFLLLLVIVAAPVLPEVAWIGGAVALAAVLAAGLATAAVVFAVWKDRPVHALAGLLGRLPFVTPEQIEHTGENLARGLAGLRHGRIALAGSAWTTCSWLLTALSFWLATLAFDLDLPLSSGVLVLGAIGLSLLLPAAPGGLGVFEAATVLALDAYGVSREEALSYAFALHALNLFPFLLAGAVATRFTRPPR